MNWIVLSLTSAFCLAASDTLAKRAMPEHDEYLVAWYRLAIALPFMLPVLIFIPVPPLDRTFFLAFFIALPIELLTTVLYVRALRISPLSLTLPFLSLTPVALIAVSYLLLHERVSPGGGAGIFLIAFGSYVLHFGNVKKGLLEPFRAITKEKGSVLMIVVAVLYSGTSSLGKMAIEHSSPLFFAVTYYTAVMLLFTPIVVLFSKQKKEILSREILSGSLVLSGVLNAVMILTHMVALTTANVAYMIAVKRVSLLIGIIFGYLFFREGEIKKRLLGGLLMFAGFVLIVTAR